MYINYHMHNRNSREKKERKKGGKKGRKKGKEGVTGEIHYILLFFFSYLKNVDTVCTSFHPYLFSFQLSLNK